MSDAKKVLIVDDDVVFADFLRAAVESVGHRAVVVTNGGLAAAAFAEHRPDLVMLDILLPGSDGFQLCKDLRGTAGGERLPIVLMTGIYKKAAFERQGLKDCGATEYVHKPFGVQCLWRMLETHLGAVTGDAEPELPPECADLAARPLVEVLAEHVEANSNGVLFVRSRGVTYAIYLQWGEPVFIRSNDPADRLHEVLQRSGQVTREQVEDALQAVAESRGKLRLGQALVRRGVVSEERFQVALQLQLRLIFQNAFALREGSCSFIPGSHPTEEDVLLAIRPRALLLLGSKAASRHRALAAALPGSRAPLGRGVDFPTRLTELSLKPHEKAIAQLADGTLTAGRFRAIAASSGCDGVALLHGFLRTGLLEAGEEPPGGERLPQTIDWDAERFAQLPVAAAIADLHRVSATGTLEVRAVAGGPAKRVVYRRGAIVAVQSDVEEDRLGDMLIRLKLLNEAELDQVIATFGEVEPDDRALARALATSGHVLPLQVYWAAVYQAQGAVHGLFALRGACLCWKAGAEPEGTVELPDLPTGEVVWAAARSLPGAALRVLLPPKTTWLRARDDAPARLATLPVEREERALLERLREAVQLEALLREKAGQKDEVRRRLFGLLSTRLACETAAPSVTEADAEEAFEGSGGGGADFLDLLHEDGFETGSTGQHAVVDEGSALLAEELTGLIALDGGGDEASGEPASEPASEPAAEPASDDDEDEDEDDALLSLGFADDDEGFAMLADGGEPAGVTGGDGDSDGFAPLTEGDASEEIAEAAEPAERLAALLDRLSAARRELRGSGRSIDEHREGLESLLAECGELVRGLLEAARGREPAGAGDRR